MTFEEFKKKYLFRTVGMAAVGHHNSRSLSPTEQAKVVYDMVPDCERLLQQMWQDARDDLVPTPKPSPNGAAHHARKS